MKTFAATFVPFIIAVSALPTSNIQAHIPGDILVCTGENYTGDCTTLSGLPFNECQPLPEPYFKNVGSFKPEAGAFCRITYTADSCTPHGDAFIWPTDGAPNLHQFDDPATGETTNAGSRMTSFLCQQCTGCS
ncbi:hypothetical protein CC78DRAFT_565808 [Lojkania enalia]|uniref:Uncharacterized protein n=1 Tax=Lojkania enalia TaxID=147567 RepID=A0A9P4KJA0_9PLEO|nr:hypothetical protein CC78DRAFT_565808 [Didymosphaeria enalia]